jgi:hypothetical protein
VLRNVPRKLDRPQRPPARSTQPNGSTDAVPQVAPTAADGCPRSDLPRTGAVLKYRGGDFGVFSGEQHGVLEQATDEPAWPVGRPGSDHRLASANAHLRVTQR